MMKRIAPLLMLLLTLALPAALAEETAPYTPGSVTENLFTDAFERGDMVLLDIGFAFTLSENAGAIFGEDADMVAAVAELLENTKLTVGAGKIENGLRVTLAGDYTVQDQSAALGATLDLMNDGVAVTGSFLPGERITAKWETILSLCGMSKEEIASFMSLRDADIKALLAEMMTQMQPVIEMAAQMAAPYGETIMAHIAGLPMVINENVPAEYGYPAAAMEMQIQVTAKAAGDLVIALCEQLRQDTTLCAMLDMALAETAEEGTTAVTTAQLCDAVIQAAQEELTDETMPLNIFIGMDEAGNLLYLNIIDENEDGTFATINYIAGQLEETGASLINIDVLTLSAAQEILDGFSLVIAYDVDNANSNIMSAEVLLGGYEAGAEILSFTFYADNAAADAEGRSGYAGLVSMALSAPEGENTASIAMNADVSSALTADGGEAIDVTGAVIIASGSEEMPMTFDASVLTETAAPSAVMTEAVQLPDLGIAEFRETYTLRTQPQAASAETAEIALETASPEAFAAMAERALASLEQTLTTLFKLLPPELMQAAQAPALSTGA